MNWFKNLKIKTRFFITFVTILVSFLAVIFSNYTSISSMIKNYDQEVKLNEQLIEKSMYVIEKVMQIRINAINDAISLEEEGVNLAKESTLENIKRQMEPVKENANKEMENYLQTVKNSISTIEHTEESNAKKSEQVTLMESIIDLTNRYIEDFYSYVEAVTSGDMEEANRLDEEATKIGNDLFTNLYNIPKIAFEGLIQEFKDIKNNNIKNLAYSIIISIISISIAATLATFLSLTTRKPIAKLTSDTKTISKGNLNVSIRLPNKDEISELSNCIGDMADVFENILKDINKLANELENGNCSYYIDSNKYEGVFKDVIDSINKATRVLVEDTLYTIERVKEFGEGNFTSNIKEFPGEKKAIKTGLDSVKNALSLVSSDISDLIQAANEGNLEFKLDSEKYSGQWQETCKGLNSFIRNVVIPIKETQNALNQFSMGNFEYRITNEYKGEFNEIKKVVNFTAETIGSYISEISETLTKMANKNFNVSIDREYLGNFKEIQDSVNNIVTNLNILVKDIISSAEQVNAGAKQMSESSISLSEGATEQAEAVDNLTSSIELISKQSVKNAENSEKANELALKTKESAASGNTQMNNMLKSIEEINKASSSISNIIKVIDDIAFQTNILALNAAVEAARAGEHGKGFAVVAEEVRSLAARSQEAAKETTKLIQGSINKVEEGFKIANDTAQSLLVIVNQIEEISNLVNSCALSSKEQEKSIKKMSFGISQISNVTQDNNATSQESAAASQELANQVEVFYTSISDFKLKDKINNSVIQLNDDAYNENINPILFDDTAVSIDSDINDNSFGKY